MAADPPDSDNLGPPAFVALPGTGLGAVSRGVAASSDSGRAGGRVSAANAVLAVLLLVFLAASAIPLGSNRPALWIIWGVVLGAVGLAYAMLLLGLGARPRVGLAAVGGEALLFVLLILWITVQALPLGGLLPLTLTTPTAQSIVLKSISLDPDSTVLAGLQFASFAVLFMLTLQVAANQQRARRLLLALFFVIAGFAAYGLASLTTLGDTLLGGDKEAYQGFVTGTFINRNSFATFLATGSVLGLSLLFDPTDGQRTLSIRTTRRTAIGLGLMLILAALFGTGSRMGAVSAAAGLLLAAGLNARSLNTTLSRLVLGAAVALLVVVGLATLTGAGLVERLLLTQGLDTGRADVHAMTLSAILARPWLGYGAGSFASTFPLFLAPSATAATVWEYPHSTYLSLWYELGTLFGSVPLVVIACLGLRAASSLAESLTRPQASAALGTIAVFACHSLMDFSAEIEANAFLLTFVLALGVAGGTRRRKRGVR